EGLDVGEIARPPQLSPPLWTAASKQMRSSVQLSGRTRSPSGPSDRIVLRHRYCAVDGDWRGSPWPNASGASQVLVRRWRQRNESASPEPVGFANRRIGS